MSKQQVKKPAARTTKIFASIGDDGERKHGSPGQRPAEFTKGKKGDNAAAGLAASVTDTSGTNSLLEAGEPRKLPVHAANAKAASPRLRQEGIKVVSGPPGAHTGLKCNQSLIEHISLQQ